MFTKENIKSCLESLKRQEIENVMDSDLDFVACELHIFNVGGYMSIEPVQWTKELNTELFDNGNMLIDKEELLQLVVDTECNNEFFNEYL